MNHILAMLSITGVLPVGRHDRNPPAAASHTANACARLSEARAARW